MTGAIIIIMIGLTLIIGALAWGNNTNNKVRENFNKLNLPPDYGISNILLQYLGGHHRMSGAGRVLITAAKDNLLWTGKSPISIPLDTIKKVEVKTEKQITSDVTLTRLLLTGVFAFGLKKKKVHEDIFLIFDFEENGVEYTAIFQGEKYQLSEMQDIVGIINKNLINMRTPIPAQSTPMTL